MYKSIYLLTYLLTRFGAEYPLPVIFWPKLTYTQQSHGLCASWASCSSLRASISFWPDVVSPRQWHTNDCAEREEGATWMSIRWEGSCTYWG